MLLRYFMLGMVLTFLLGVSGCRKDADCPSSVDKEFALTNFSRISAGENFILEIKKGADYSVKASGCSRDLQDLNLQVATGNALKIEYDRYRSGRNRVYLEITTPVLATIQLSGAAKATVDGFDGQNSVIRNVLSGVAECVLNGTGINTNVELSGDSKLTVSGSTLSLYGNISGTAKLYSYELQSQEVDITTSSLAKAYVFPQQEFYATASGDSRIFYKGNPLVKHLVQTGTARVIQE